MKEYIEDLFQYLDTYEKKYASFQTEGFLQTYNGICAVFQALRQQRDKAIEVDQFFLERIQQSPLSSSDLRQITIQVLITNFESEADIDGLSNRSYLFVRGLRPVKHDIPYFEQHLVPLLFREGSLNNNFRLNMFLMEEMARIINTYGSRVQQNLSPESFSAMPEPVKFLELARRRQALGHELAKDRTTLEFHLQRIEAFSKLREKSKLNEYYLTQWKYFSSESFWSKISKAFSEMGAKIGGAFSSSRYFRLTLKQRNPAFIYYTLVIIVMVFLAIYIPSRWQKYTEKRLVEFRIRSGQTQPSNGK
jgi:hypothetical protein